MDDSVVDQNVPNKDQTEGVTSVSTSGRQLTISTTEGQKLAQVEPLKGFRVSAVGEVIRSGQ